jgi:hypothetical protein
LAGREVFGLWMEICLKERYIKYTKPALNGVNKSNNLHTKWPPVNRILR